MRRAAILAPLVCALTAAAATVVPVGARTATHLICNVRSTGAPHPTIKPRRCTHGRRHVTMALGS
jgi:hypothetical protein